MGSRALIAGTTVHGDEHRYQDRRGYGNRYIGVELAGLEVEKPHRSEHEYRRKRRREYRRPYAAHAGKRGFHTAQTLAALAHDALEHDDAVVQSHADGKGDAGKRNDVDRSPCKQQPEERGNGADRNADDANQRGAE